MTVEEIKAYVSMYDVLARYGFRVFRGACSCPFHGEDRHPSMQIYKDGFRCYACGEHGDVIDFVRKVEHCDFKTAFAILGGSHEVDPEKMRKIEARRQAALEEKNKKQKAVRELNKAISLCRTAQAILPGCEYTDRVLQFSQNELPILLGMHESLMNGEEVDYGDIYRRSRKTVEGFLV